jgi:hypothetical protein
MPLYPGLRSEKGRTGFAFDRDQGIEDPRFVAKPPAVVNSAQGSHAACSLGFRKLALTFVNSPSGFHRQRWRSTALRQTWA